MTSNDVAIEAALAGTGISRLHSCQAIGKIEAGRLEIILEGYEEKRLPIHIPHREAMCTTAKTHAFVDILAGELCSRRYTV